MSKLTHFADQAIEYLFYTLFFFVPLLLWPKTSEVFEFNKMLFVYLTTILIGAAWIVKWLASGKLTVRRTPLDLPILFFLASQIASTVFSIDTHTSLWGYYSRFHGGLVSTFAYVILYYALVTNFRRERVNFLIYSILASAALVSAYGVLEHFGIDRHLWVQDVQNRVFSSIGQPNWLSAYLVALLPLPIFLAIAAKKPSRRLAWAVLALLFFITILYTKSQSGISATYLILALIPIYLVGKKYKLVYLLAGVVFLAGLIYKWDFVQKLSPLGPPNLARLIEEDRRKRIAGSDSMLIRQVVWQGARELAVKNPIFGTGVETFGYSYFTVRPALHNLLSEWEFLYNKAHNEYLNFLANTGFVGFFTYLTLIVWTLFWWRRRADPVCRALLFGYLSILVTNYFGFSVVPVALFFFLFPALVLLIVSKDKEEYLSLNFHINKYLGFLLLAPLTVYLLSVPVNQWRADIAYNTGKQYLALSAFQPSLQSLRRAVSLSPKEAVFYAQLAESEAQMAAAVNAQLTALPATASADLVAAGKQLLTDLTTAALADSQKAMTMNPHHTNLWKSKAKVELYLGTFAPEYNQKALQTLIDLSAISPTDAKVVYNIGILADSLGQKEAAQAAYRKAVELKPDYDAARGEFSP